MRKYEFDNKVNDAPELRLTGYVVHNLRRMDGQRIQHR